MSCIWLIILNWIKLNRIRLSNFVKNEIKVYLLSLVKSNLWKEDFGRKFLPDFCLQENSKTLLLFCDKLHNQRREKIERGDNGQFFQKFGGGYFVGFSFEWRQDDNSQLAENWRSREDNWNFGKHWGKNGLARQRLESVSAGKIKTGKIGHWSGFKDQNNDIAYRYLGS